LVLNQNDFTFSLKFRRSWPLAANVNINFTLLALLLLMRLLIAADVQQIFYVFYG